MDHASEKGSRRGHAEDTPVIGVHLPLELLDNFIGSWCAMMIPHRSEAVFAKYKDDDSVPDGVRFLKAALEHEAYGGDVDCLIDDITQDFRLRCLKQDRIKTFEYRVRALKLLLDAIDKASAADPFASPTALSGQRATTGTYRAESGPSNNKKLFRPLEKECA